uniref:N-acetyltransferase domain-containing protein n=1 Tax=Heterorhabditis bacteriophora TaxID=37862 RepID=A0A1I7XFK0_HETBA
MFNHFGQLNHQFVLPEHRQKGLGKIVELDISQKCIR